MKVWMRVADDEGIGPLEPSPFHDPWHLPGIDDIFTTVGKRSFRVICVETRFDKEEIHLICTEHEDEQIESDGKMPWEDSTPSFINKPSIFWMYVLINMTGYGAAAAVVSGSLKTGALTMIIGFVSSLIVAFAYQKWVVSND